MQSTQTRPFHNLSAASDRASSVRRTLRLNSERASVRPSRARLLQALVGRLRVQGFFVVHTTSTASRLYPSFAATDAMMAPSSGLAREMAFAMLKKSPR